MHSEQNEILIKKCSALEKRNKELEGALMAI